MYGKYCDKNLFSKSNFSEINIKVKVRLTTIFFLNIINESLLFI